MLLPNSDRLCFGCIAPLSRLVLGSARRVQLFHYESSLCLCLFRISFALDYLCWFLWSFVSDVSGTRLWYLHWLFLVLGFLLFSSVSPFLFSNLYLSIFFALLSSHPCFSTLLSSSAVLYSVFCWYFDALHCLLCPFYSPLLLYGLSGFCFTSVHSLAKPAYLSACICYICSILFICISI